ncbi:FAD binding domain-containing protein [Fonsecaea pedrosoi]|nr:FAD binding domain-containing protein [Fonsecaea pedrosoi]
MAESITEQLDHLRSLLSEPEVILPSSERYDSHTSTWAAQKNLHPRLVVRPGSTQSLSKVLQYLSTSDLDMAVRSSGYGSASARDVLISMEAFNEFSWDREKEILTLGAGQLWRDYYEKMDRVAPEYHVVAARTPALGIGGSILSGGFSWLARQYGNTSDPANMLDAEVVKMDGTVLWASQDPDLLWTLRGAGASFCVVTKFKLRAYPCPQDIYAGPIIVPRRQLALVAGGIASMNARSETLAPQVSMDLYVVKKEQAAHMGATEDLLIVQAFDALGREHGRSEEGFKWALDVPGAMDMTRVTNLRGVSQMHEQTTALKGRFKTLWQPLIVETLSEETILGAVRWFDHVGATGDRSIANSAQLVFECLCTRDSTSGAGASAWPRPLGMKYTIICAAGCDATTGATAGGKSTKAEEGSNGGGGGDDGDHDDSDKLTTARQLLHDAPRIVFNGHGDQRIRYAPNALEEYHDLKDVYAEHLPKLLSLKKLHDPRNKLKGPINYVS